MILKICPTCKNEFRTKRNNQVSCSKTCAQHNPEVIDKMKKSQKSTYQKNYGTDHPMKTQNVVENFKKSMMNKHGVEHALQSKKFIEKSKNTKKKRYGNENYNNYEQIKQTCLNRYGVNNIRNTTDVIQKVNEQIMDRHYKYIKNLCKEWNITFLSERNEYIGYHFKNLYKFKCDICGNEFEHSVYHLSNIYCNKCHPDRRLELERSFFEFLSSIVPKNIEIKRRDRVILNGKELDFYIPFKKIAFEINGLYWHSNVGGGIQKNYHLNKTNNCLFHGVRLIHILENEWIEKTEIVKSIINSILGYRPNKIFARTCEIRTISTKDKNTFLNKSHIQGEDKSTIKLGLYHDNELVSVMTFRKTSRFDKTVEWEISRFCNKLNYTTIGGASKLFQHFVKTHNPKSIVSYSDRRYFNGNVYINMGMKFDRNTVPNYYYITDKYKGVKNRMSFQKHKLKFILPKYDDSLSEWENMKNNGFDRIWDCGHTKWIWSNNHTDISSLIETCLS